MPKNRRPGNQSELAYQQLKSRIVTGEMPPGTRLIEVQLAEELSVSRTPVREAVRRLQTENLVSRDPTGALIVHQPSPLEIDGVYTIRQELDGLAARLAAQRISESELTWLEHSIVAMKEALAEGRVPDAIAANIEFHDMLYQAASNPHLERMGRQLRDFVRLFSRQPLEDSDRAADIIREHREIVAALRERDAERAETVSRAHVQRARQNVTKSALEMSSSR
jgi:DNA-binding GntR family transcriptional regulator